MSDAASLVLYSGPLSMFGAKVQIAMLEKNLDFELVMVAFDMKLLYQPKHPEVLRINPKQQVPVLVHGDLALFDSTQIFEYLEELQPTPRLWPAGLASKARARLLEHRADEVYFPPVIRLMSLQDQLQEPAAIAACEACAAYYRSMEVLLEGRDWLAGSYSFADIAFYMAQLFGARMGAPMGEGTPRLLVWRERMSARPAVRQVAGAMGRYLLSQNRVLPEFLAALVNQDTC
ncbi:glutathione S-transferase family protein [Polaromonas eurypsychrophila]|uniref:Glutathione S-transferase n=1 Tax=Polaromonas eurypsychrophila TaxID=1614635 RepID=A0A916WIC2_9BURK|nr:glutathione S-transferase family protein [Polaromonas eurypsychrophila]GGB00077.1 glutathione S-transferase [Polaromonas eurypsychrophila]